MEVNYLSIFISVIDAHLAFVVLQSREFVLSYCHETHTPTTRCRSLSRVRLRKRRFRRFLHPRIPGKVVRWRNVRTGGAPFQQRRRQGGFGRGLLMVAVQSLHRALRQDARPSCGICSNELSCPWATRTRPDHSLQIARRHPKSLL